MGKFSFGVEGVYQSARGGIKDYIRKHKILLIVLSFVALVSVLTGVFTAIKNADNYSSVWFDNYNIMNFYNSKIGTWELFFNRFGSYLICLGVVFICSFNIFLSPFSVVVLVIRSYLVGLNCCFMFLLFGLSGMLTTIIIILPIQLINVLLLIAFCSLMFVRARNKQKYGSYCIGGEKKPFVLFLIFLVLFTVVNVVETLLLFIFSSKIILVI